MEKIWNEVKSFLKTFFFFIIACILLPVILLCFIYVHCASSFVNYILTIKYPRYTISTSKKIRSLIDTPRNAGIFHFLVEVSGPCDFEKIQRFYAEHLTDAHDELGFLKFPKLRQKLLKLWGHYAWENDNSSFKLNNHVIMAPNTYRGRVVSDANLQDFVSELVMKYIPSDLPQWQVIVIPIVQKNAAAGHIDMSENEHYYLLVKIHHLIIAEEEDLHISEMLMLQRNGRRNTFDINQLTQRPKPKNPSYFIRNPVHIQNFLRHIRGLIVNYWNAFIYEFESLETPDGYRCPQITNLTQLLSVLLIIVVNVFLDYRQTINTREKLRRRTQQYREKRSKWETLKLILTHEVEQRNLSWQIAYTATRNSLQLANILKSGTWFLWRFNVNQILLSPYHLYCEMLACRDLIIHGRTELTSTYLGGLSVYIPMIIYAQMEFFKICYEIFKAPVNIYEELFERPTKESNILHIKSYSGRKIVSFSKSFDATKLRERINFSTEVRESDFILSCLAGAIYDYIEKYKDKAAVPKLINTTCRTMAKGYLTENTGGKTDFVGGVVLLQLPLRTPDREHARQLHYIVENIRRKQIMIYLASMAQSKFDFLTALMPRVLTKICINFFACNFPITITEIHGSDADFQTRWGQKVNDVLLFRPPQSKTCLSLNIHRFGDKYRLAVMADTELGCEHAMITRSFENYMDCAAL